MDIDEIFSRASWNRLPEHCRGALERYIRHGIPPGHFLTALLSNDLRETFARGDDINLAAVRDYVVFLHCDAPSACSGSPSRFAAWVESGGLVGHDEVSA